MVLLTVHLAPKTYWIRPDAGVAGGILNTATAGSVNACRSSEVLEDVLKYELGVELLGVDPSGEKTARIEPRECACWLTCTKATRRAC